MNRIIGIDYGDKRVGIAVSDLLGFGAHGVGTIENNGLNSLISEIMKTIAEYSPEKIVVGMPLNMDGTKGFRTEATEKFITKLSEQFPKEIIRWDERLTTMGAARFLNETNTRGKKRKDVIDTVSACLILDSYLSSTKNS
ncbi:MAG: Holliday junction resolvase RuvX [Clostridia bacterium]|nr:Holliday junction resolvase RuvX [Clostridia bacterium]